ncbi:MAG: caspase family protein [Acidobacteria bacterium]|nr:caspase family protein [Acidobacteriota bacterium]MBI3427722.1 caspase family protein [Acidobacteriota bacterium]
MLLGTVLLFGLSQASAQDRANPLPLPGTEIKGTLRPGVRTETFYALEASGSVEFTLSVTGYQDWAMLEVEVLDTSFVPLLKFEASASTPNGSDKRAAKLRLGGKQIVLLRLSGPSANKSGTYSLKLSGQVAGAHFSPTVPTTAQKKPAEAPIENWSVLLKQQKQSEPEPQRTANPTPAPRESGKAVAAAMPAVASAIREIGADKRFALLIGNSAYETVPLKNPVNDARAMAEVLAECGFQVTMLENADKRRMEEAIRAFGAKLDAKSVGLFYFAGHGIQVNGTNYLVPLGVRIEKEADVEYETVDAGRVLSEFANARNALSILILDACRDNPFAAATRSLTRGLAVVKLPKEANGTLVAYATSPGNVARDGTGQNGLYTEELLRNLRKPGLKIEDVFKLTRIGVKERSNGSQVPWENSSIDGDFFFVRR